MLPTTRFIGFFFIVLLLLPATVHGQRIQFETLPQQVIEQRLRAATPKNQDRELSLIKIFEQAGCTGDKLTTQVVKHQKFPNVICVFPGITEKVIVVGAHYDHVSVGDGAVDNWSGASLLPSLFESLSGSEHRHTFVFVSFTGEEDGLVGSAFYAKQLTPEQRANIEAMVDIDSLGLSPTKVWASRADPQLLKLLAAVSKAINLPLSGVNVEQVGTSDGASFEKYKIPTITIHSVTQDTLKVLHTPKDTIAAVNMDDYYASYKLLSGYLVLLDQRLGLSTQAEAETKRLSAPK